MPVHLPWILAGGALIGLVFLALFRNRDIQRAMHAVSISVKGQVSRGGRQLTVFSESGDLRVRIESDRSDGSLALEASFRTINDQGGLASASVAHDIASFGRPVHIALDPTVNLEERQCRLESDVGEDLKADLRAFVAMALRVQTRLCGSQSPASETRSA